MGTDWALTSGPICPHNGAMNPVILELAAARQISPYAVKKWRQRGKVPTKYWYPLLAEAETIGKPLTVADFEWPVKKPKRKRMA